MLDLTREKYFQLDLDSEYPNMVQKLELSERKENGVTKLYEGERLGDILYRIRWNIKELGHILYNYRDLKNPETKTYFYHSYNHYYRVVNKVIDDFEDLIYYGVAKTDFNPEKERDLKKCCKKLNNLYYNMSAINDYKKIKRQLNKLDQKRLEILIDELDELTVILFNEIKDKNYFIMLENEIAEDGINEEELNTLFDLPDSSLFDSDQKK